MSFPYKTSIEKSMKKFYDSLCEKDKRRYAAIESEKLSHGGVNYISTLLEGRGFNMMYQAIEY